VITPHGLQIGAPVDGRAGSNPDRIFDCYVFDLDGTIYLGDELLPGALRLVQSLREANVPVRFVTNNPTHDPREYSDKLTRLGLPTLEEEIVSTTLAMTQWILTCAPTAVVFPIGEEPLTRALDAAGIKVSNDPTQIDIVIASYDRGFDYAKLQIAFDAIRTHKRARLVATNPDRFCPLPGGRGEPDCAAIVAAIEACTDTSCEVTVGKPNRAMLDAALSGLDVSMTDCLMVGDRLSTDIQMGREAGMQTALVLTGETTLADLRSLPTFEHPTYAVERIDHLLPIVGPALTSHRSAILNSARAGEQAPER
jgi:phosphoglycolate/pyridoxal phosphate phosphatase family enzyme